ncbi:MAG: Ig-like domain-containing protein [Bacillota bacterium]|nr:Ig-like domain-containing protein [Bacillota bacterium]
MLRNKKKYLMLIAFAGITYLTPAIVKAEGSRELVNNYDATTKQYTDNSGYRPFLWADDTKTAGITRRTTFKVYAKEGETINLGSSIIKTGSISYKKPGDTTWTSLNVTSTSGYISTITQERIGPYITATAASAAATTGGYTPITLPVTTGEAGVWEFQFNAAVSSGNPVMTKGSGNFITAQKGSSGSGSSTIGAWDITVSDTLGNEIPGRMFTPYIAMIVGSNANTTSTTTSTAVKVLNNDFYILTKDGYLYQTSMNGVDPNGFVFWANNRGFIDKTNNKTLYHSVDGGDDNLASATSTMLTGNLGPQLPSDTDTSTDITHNVFVNKPSDDLKDILNVNAISPEVPAGFKFTGSSSVDGKTPVKSGGTFAFTATKTSSYRLIIDTDGHAGFDLASDVVIENVSTAGLNTITWNGKDKSGNTLPIGTYKAQLIMKGGEYHFPMLDAEYNPFGTKIKLVNAPGYSDPESYADKYKIYYDENNYTTANGVSVNLNASNSAFNIGNLNGLAGVDSSNGAHGYLGNYGNWKGIDTWTYFPGQAVQLTFDVTPTVSNITKNAQEDNSISFSPTDFISKFTDGGSNTLTSVKITSLPANGQLKLNGIPVNVNQEIPVSNLAGLTFTPNADWNGNTSFSWNGSSGTIYSANDAYVNIGIAAVNDAPVATPESLTVDEDNTLNGSLKVSDVEGDPLTYTVLQQPLHGTLIVNPNGTYTYTPYANYNGPDSFTFKANDGQLDSNIATVNIAVNPVNDAPVASASSETTDEDKPLSGNLHVTDIDSSTLTYSVVQGPTNGTVTINPDGTYTYTPNPNYNGSDSFTFKANDGQADSNIATVSINVNAINDPPVATSDNVTTDEDKPLTGKLKVTDVDSTTLTYTVVQGPSNGTLSVNPDGTYTYTPNANYNGTDSFTFKANDGQADSSVATVNITVNPINDAPVAASDNKQVDEDETLSGNLHATDIDSTNLTYTVVQGPSNGTVTINSDGSYTYTPNANYNGTDSFTFKANDGQADSNVATVNITVNSVNDIPVVYNINKNGTEDTVLTFTAADFSSEFEDVDGSLQGVRITSLPLDGTLRLNGEAVHVGDEIPSAALSGLTFTPDANWNGNTSFGWSGSDGTAYAVLGAKVNLAIAPVNDAPVASASSETTDEDKPLNGDLHITDIDSSTLTYSVVQGPSNGTVTINSDGSYTYTPNPNYNGTDSFTFKANDGQADSNVATVSITVNSVNDAPTVTSYSGNADYNSPVSGTIIGTDVDGDPLTYSQGSSPSNGTVVVNADGTWVYTPNTGATGSDIFTVKVSDGNGGIATSTVNIVIDTPPTVISYNKNVDYNTPLSGTVVGSDIDGNSLSYSKGSSPIKGTVVVNADGTWVYTPSAGATGSDSFTVNVSDGHGGTAVSTVNIIIDTPPVVGDYSKNVDFNTTLSGAVAGSDIDGNSLSYSKGSSPIKGTVVVNTDGTWVYTPNAGATGSDSFTVKVSDGHGGIATSTVNIVIDTPPTVISYNKNVDYNTPLSGTVAGSDIDGNSLSYSKGSSPIKGTVVVNADGTWVYTPNAGATGSDSFTVNVNDGHGGIATSTVNIVIDTPPVVGDYNKNVDYNTPLSGVVVGSDIDGNNLSYSKGSSPSKGSVVINADGTWVYTPNAGATGSDSFTVKVSDGHGGTATSTVNIVIDTPPMVENYNTTTNYNTPVSGKVVGSDTDKDSLSYSKGSSPSKGSAVVNADGTWGYTPNAGASGRDSFTVLVSDGHGGIATSTVNIVIDTPPVAPDYNRTTPYNKQVSGTVVGSDIDNDSLSYSLSSDPSNGYVYLNNSGEWIYTPKTNFVGTDSFKVEVKDGHGGSSISNITVTVKDKLTLVGTVVDEDTKAPLADTKIELSDLSGKLIYSTVTDANGNYRIDNAKIGLYEFKVTNSQYGSEIVDVDVEPTNETEYTMREDFNLAKAISYSLKLDSNPVTILGDGKSTSILTARITDNNNRPVANTKVIFSAAAGSFPDGTEAVTDENGIARITFKSDKVYGTENKVIPVTATVDDNSLNLHAKDQIFITFEPGMIAGVVIDNDTNQPVSGAVVEVSKDFDNDGIADFYSKVVTGADGRYEIAIPKGNVQYNVTITKPVKVGNDVVQVQYNQKSDAGTVTGAGNETYSSVKTAAGVILTKDTDGSVSLLQDYSNFSIDVVNTSDLSAINNDAAELKSVDGINAYINDKGVFEAEGLEKGKDYTVAISYTFPNGEKIIVGTVKVSVNNDGQINLSSALIDPYGTITDAITNNIITGANVKLYYADTQRNIDAGRTPNTLVNLPGVPGFEPADNKNPQGDDSKGKYAFMVFPDADYYIVVEKDGYETYVSGTISVGKELVKQDIQMKPVTNAAKAETKVEAKPEVKATLATLPKTGSPIDMESLSAIGLVILASGIGLTLKSKKKK